MELYMYAVRDAKTEVFGQPIFQMSQSQAERSFETALLNPNDPMHQYPEDYALFEVGVYDDNNGGLQGLQPRQIITGLEALRAARLRQQKLDQLQNEIEEIKNPEVEYILEEIN